MKTQLKPISLAILLISQPAFATDASTELETVTINADLREASEQEMPASVSVQTQADLQDQGASHFDDVLLKTPNVNFSGQSSRARHLLIRGIGERDEYTGAPNSSIGFAIDDIDFSGIGMAASAFDIKQIEVLRGPQNIRSGQSAIGGLINVQSNEPTSYRESMIEASAGQDSLTELGIMTSGPFNSDEKSPQYRIAIFKHDSDGFRENKTLNRDDTNGKDELTAKAKLRFFPSDATTVDVTLLHADLNNGYDAWSADNSYNTLSNKPGKDTLETNAASLKISHNTNAFKVISKTSIADSNLEYSYDYDWGPTTAYGADYANFKDRQNISQELRIVSTENSKLFGNTDWLAGVYASRLDEENQESDAGYLSSSDYTLDKFAGFGQLDYHMNDKAVVSASLRLEHQKRDYQNDFSAFDPSDTLWGASLSYAYTYNPVHTAYTSITRGYKAGGFNSDFAGTNNVQFDEETLYNFEMGLKSNYSAIGLKTQLVAFYMDRNNPQFDGYTAPSQPGLDPWMFYTENFDSAKNYGIEASFDWQASTALNFYGALGLIKTKVEGTPANYYVVTNREQSHAPSYQLNLGAKYRASNGFYAAADITAVDSFYFDNVHNFKSQSYEILNARLGYEAQDYEVYLWAKNLTDETYATRGFYFDLDWDGQNDEFIRLGDPRQLGITARVYF